MSPSYANEARRWIVRLVAAVLLLNLLGAAGQAPAAVRAESLELIANEGFETVVSGQPASWVMYGSGGTLASNTDPSYVRSGGASVKLVDPLATESFGLRSALIPVTPGVSYKGSVYAYQLYGNAHLYLEYWDVNGNRIDVQTITGTVTAQWEKLEITRTAPAGTVHATLLLYLDIANVGTTYFDDASLRAVDANLGFEDVAAGKPLRWTPLDSGSTYESAQDIVYAGDYSVKLSDASATLSTGLRSSRLPVEPGSVYEATVQAYNLAGGGQLYLEYWDSSHTRIGVKIGESSALNQWRPIRAELAAPAGTAYATLLLYLHGSNVGATYYDEATLALAPEDPVREFPLAVSGHPRLYFTSADLPTKRAHTLDATNSFFGKTGSQLWSELEAKAEAYLAETSYTVTYYGGHLVTYPLPPAQPGPMANPPGFTEGTYPYWTLMSRAVEERLEILSLAYAMTEDETYADKAKDYLMSVIGWSAWTDPGYGCAGVTCLDTAHLTMGVSMAYDVLYPLLTTTERQSVRSALETKGLEPLYADVKTKVDVNLQMLRASALASGGSVLLGESPNAERYLTRATDYYAWYLDTRMNSGQQEGMLYTSYSVDNMIRGLDHLSRVTGMRDYIEHPFFDDFLTRWVNYFLAPGGAGLANYSDSSVANFFTLTMLAVNSWLDSGAAGRYLVETEGSADAFSQFLFYDTTPTLGGLETWPQSAVLEEIGWAALRSGWDKEDTLLTFVSNDSKLGHNHYDQNSFQLAVNGSWIAGDPGYQDFSAGAAHDYTSKLGHSTIQVDGQGQSLLGGGTLTRGMLADDYSYVRGSAPGAYGNPSLTRFDRHIVHVNNDYYVMLDDLQADVARTFEWVLFNGNLYDFAIDGAAAAYGQTTAGEDLWFTNGAASLNVKFLGGQPLPMRVGSYAGAESYGQYTKVQSAVPAQSYQFLTVLKATPSSGSDYRQAEDLLPPAATSGKTVSVFNAANARLAFYPADQTGDYVTYAVEVEEAGTYNLATLFIQSPLYGRVQAYVDGQPVGGVFDGYSPLVQAAAPFEQGQVTLAAGSHTIRYETVGKNTSSGNYFIGIDAIRLQPTGGSSGPGEPKQLAAEQLSGSGATGALVARGDASAIEDRIVFRTGSSAYTIGGIASDAEQAVVSATSGGAVTGFSMTAGSTLAYAGVTLLDASSAIRASFAVDPLTGTTSGVVELDTAAALDIHIAAAPTEVYLGGSLLPASAYSYDALAAAVTLALPAGAHRIEVRTD